MDVLKLDDSGGRPPVGVAPGWALPHARREAQQARQQADQAQADARQAAQAAHEALARCIAAHDQDVAAFVARKLLRPGHPCPVCGSAEHPAPARAGADTDGADYELADARRRRDRAQRQAQAAQRRLLQAEARLAALLAERS